MSEAVASFDLDLAILTNPDQFGETFRIIPIALVHTHRESCVRVTSIDADHRKIDPPELVPKPARHCSGLKADALCMRCSLAKKLSQGVEF